MLVCGVTGVGLAAGAGLDVIAGGLGGIVVVVVVVLAPTGFLLGVALATTFFGGADVGISVVALSLTAAVVLGATPFTTVLFGAVAALFAIFALFFTGIGSLFFSVGTALVDACLELLFTTSSTTSSTTTFFGRPRFLGGAASVVGAAAAAAFVADGGIVVVNWCFVDRNGGLEGFAMDWRGEVEEEG